MPRSPIPDLTSLVGGWRLESLVLTFSDNGEREEPYGPDPEGYMVLEASGRIMFLFTKRNRSRPVSDSDRALLFNDMTAYTGLVRLDGPGRFVTTIDLAWNPAFPGELLRCFTQSKGCLSATAAPIVPGACDLSCSERPDGLRPMPRVLVTPIRGGLRCA